jgi:hypothetical protein
MITINKDGLSYNGDKDEIIQNFINISLNISRIAKLDPAEIERLSYLVPSLVKNDGYEEKKNELIKNQREEFINDLFSELNIKRVIDG